MKCECEHVSHMDKSKLTPCGNPAHKYGIDFIQFIRVYTDFGWFNVCKDCAVDCMDATQSASGVWKQGDIYRG